jgi:hypothetical protein
MKKCPIVASIIVLLFTACGTGRGVTGSHKANSNLSTKNIIATHQATSPDFKTLAARVQVVYEEEDKLQSITVSLRMEKDRTIWIKASLLGITLSKVLITPQRVSYYETISGTYFEGDFTLLSEWLGTEIDFEKAQAILLGQSIFSLDDFDYVSDVIQNKYKLQPLPQPLNFIHSIMLYPENFKIASETLSQPDDSRLLSVRYEAYQLLEGSFYPSEIEIDASEKDSKTKIRMSYKKIDLNVDLSFPFEIPDGYEEIRL